MDILNLIILIVVVGYIVVKDFLLPSKKENPPNPSISTIAVIGKFLVFDENGVDPKKINKGNIVIGKHNKRIIIAEVEDIPANENLGIYFSNGKVNRDET